MILNNWNIPLDSTISSGQLHSAFIKFNLDPTELEIDTLISRFNNLSSNKITFLDLAWDKGNHILN